MNVVDLRCCLESWPYDEEKEKNVRFGRGADGREIILVRQPMGLEQYEADGRPDGRRVHGAESYLDRHHFRTGTAAALELTADDCAEIFAEADQFNHRLIFLFRLKDWARVERDAAHILRLLEYTVQHARCAEDRAQFEPWHHHITRIRAAAQAMILLDQKRYNEALQTARRAIGIPADVDDGGPDRGRLADVVLESVRRSFANRPDFHPEQESSFIRRDDYWAIQYRGQGALLKSTRGFHCLATLLHTPGHQFHVSELLASQPAVLATGGGRRIDADQLVTAGLCDGSPILDHQAKAECKRRIEELRQELDEAERFNDPPREAKARREIDAITRYVAAAIGFGGRDRKTSSDAERARCAVTKRIKQTIQKIDHAIPALGHHLTARIKTGYFCSYNPHPDRPVSWKF